MDPRQAVEVLRTIAAIPKQDEPEEPGSPYRQDWTDGSGRYAIRALHDAIDRARSALPPAEVSALLGGGPL